MASISANALSKKLDIPKDDIVSAILKIPATKSGRRKVGDGFYQIKSR